MAILREGQAGEMILVDDGVQRMCPYDRTAWCGTGCAQFEIRQGYTLEYSKGEMPPSVFLWCCERKIDLEPSPTKAKENV